MIMNHCPVNTNLSDGQRKNCSLCHHNQYSLKGLDGTKILLEGNEKCQMELFEHEPINRIEQVPMYKKMGIQAYYVYSKFMSETQLKNAIDKVKNEL
jgi:putative protease